MTLPDEPEVARRLEERTRGDRREAWLLIGLGIPVAAAALLFFAGGLFLLLLLVPLGISWTAKFFLAFGLVSAAVLLDTWKHPSEAWHAGRYYLTDGTAAGPDDPIVVGGWASGMPAMTAISDPANLAERGREISSGCSNLVLSGPRNIRQGVERLRLARARSRAENARAALEAMKWLASRGPADEAEIAAEVARRPGLGRGFALAGELGFLARESRDGRKLVRLKAAPAESPRTPS